MSTDKEQVMAKIKDLVGQPPTNGISVEQHGFGYSIRKDGSPLYVINPSTNYCDTLWPLAKTILNIP